jgi:DNA-binding CsgD family transcriptional regulator
MCKPHKYNENPYNIFQFNWLCKGFVYSGEIAEILKIDSETLLKN